MSVVITLSDANVATQQDTIDLTVKNVLTSDEVKIEETTFEGVSFLDMTIPSALEATVVGNDTIKVKFSEPVQSADKADFEVDGGDLYIKEVQLMKKNTEANIVLYSSLEEGTVSVEVKSTIEDYADYNMTPATFEVEVEEDSEAPTVVGYKNASPTGVTLIFSEDIELVSGVDEASFYHTNSKNAADTFDGTEIDGNELTLSFTDSELPEGTAYIYIDGESLKDLWDNENPTLIRVPIEVTIDTTKPELDDIEVVTETEITLTFSEDIEDVDTDNFTILKDGEEEEGIISSVSTNGDEVTVLFTDALSGDYTIVVEDVEDGSGNVIDDVQKDFFVDDLTPPAFAGFVATLYNAGAEDQMVKVDFGEEMATEGKYSVLDIDKYEINGQALSELDADVTIKLVDKGQAVEIYIESLTDDADNGFDLTETAGTPDGDVKITRVADAAGNYTTDLFGTVGTYQLEGSVAVSDQELISKNQVKVTFADKLVKFDGDDFLVYADANDDGDYDTNEEVAVSKVAVSENADGNTVAIFTLAEDVTTDAVTDDANAYDIGFAVTGVASENIYGETVAQVSADVTDAAAPKVADVVYVDANTIEVYFSETIEADYLAAVGANGFTVSGATVDYALTLAGTGTDDTVIVLTSNDGDFTINSDVSFNDTRGTVADLDDNELANFSETDKLVVSFALEGNGDETFTITENRNEGITGGTANLVDATGAADTAQAVTEWSFELTTYVPENAEAGDALDVSLATDGVVTVSITENTAGNLEGEHVLTVTNVATGVAKTITISIDNTGAITIN